MASDRMNWDHSAHKDLIGALAEELAPSQDQLRAVAARLNALGYSCTVKAVTQHLQKLRRKGGAAGNGDDPFAPTTPRTPSKRRAPGPKTPTSGRGKRKLDTEAAGSEDDDEKVPKKIKEDPELEDSKILITGEGV